MIAERTILLTDEMELPDAGCLGIGGTVSISVSRPSHDRLVRRFETSWTSRAERSPCIHFIYPVLLVEPESMSIMGLRVGRYAYIALVRSCRKLGAFFALQLL